MIKKVLIFFLIAAATFSFGESQVPGKYETDSRSALYSSALSYFEKKEYVKAHELLTEYLAGENLTPELNASASYYLGESLFRMNQYEKAAEIYESQVNNTIYTNYRPQSLYTLGEIYYNTGKFEKSRERFHELLETYPYREYNGSVFHRIGETYSAEAEYDSAITYYLKAIDNKTTNNFTDLSIYALAETYEKTGDFESAVTYYEEILAFHRESELFPSAQIRIGICYFRLKEYDSSILELNNPVVKELPAEKKAEALYLLANSYYRIADYDNSVKSYSEFVSKYPNSIYYRDAQYALAWGYFQLKKYNDAFRIFHHLSPGTDSIGIKSFFWKAESKRYAGYDDEALLYYDEFINKFPENQMIATVHYQVGLIYFNNKKFDTATLYLLKATGTNDILTRAKAFTLLGELDLNTKNYDPAMRYFTAAIVLDPPDKELKNRATLGFAIANFYLDESSTTFDNLIRLEKEAPSFETAKVSFYIAESYFAGKEYQKALQYYNRVSTDDDVMNNFTMYGKGYCYYNLKDYTNASFQFADFIKKYPADKKVRDVRTRLADSYFADRKYSEAIKLYENLLADKNKFKDGDYVLYQYSLALFRDNQRQKALAELRKFKDNYPRSQYYENSLYLLGWIAFQQNNFYEAINSYRAFLILAPNSGLKPLIYYSIGDAYFNLGNYDSAIVSYSVIIDQYDNSSYVFDALNGIQYCYVAKGEPEVAFKMIDDFIVKNPNSIFADKLYLKKGEINYSLRNYEAAGKSYKDFITYYRYSKFLPDAYYWIGKCSENLGQTDEALYNYKIVFEQYPGNEIAISAVIEMGTIYNMQKKHGDAVNIYEKATNTFKDSKRFPELMYLKGESYVKKGDTGAAFDIFDEIVMYYEATIFADKSRLELGKIELISKRYDNALKYLQHIVGKRTDELAAESQYTMGLVYIEQKKYNDAITAFVRVTNVYANFTEWTAKSYLRMGEIYEKQKEPGKAKEIYKSLIAKHRGDEYGKEAEQKLRRLK
ncbi:MAG: tetratricopeptide repeat protein [Ignavibacteriaceae bacterium]